eukprot:1943111-Pleurochrysis_carterae.AAC.2
MASKSNAASAGAFAFRGVVRNAISIGIRSRSRSNEMKQRRAISYGVLYEIVGTATCAWRAASAGEDAASCATVSLCASLR